MWHIMGAVIMASETKLQVERSGNWGLICLRVRMIYQRHIMQAVSGPLLASYPVLMDTFCSG